MEPTATPSTPSRTPPVTEYGETKLSEFAHVNYPHVVLDDVCFAESVYKSGANAVIHPRIDNASKVILCRGNEAPSTLTAVEWARKSVDIEGAARIDIRGSYLAGSLSLPPIVEDLAFPAPDTTQHRSIGGHSSPDSMSERGRSATPVFAMQFKGKPSIAQFRHHIAPQAACMWLHVTHGKVHVLLVRPSDAALRSYYAWAGFTQGDDATDEPNFPSSDRVSRTLSPRTSLRVPSGWIVHLETVEPCNEAVVIGTYYHTARHVVDMLRASTCEDLVRGNPAAAHPPLLPPLSEDQSLESAIVHGAYHTLRKLLTNVSATHEPSALVLDSVGALHLTMCLRAMVTCTDWQQSALRTIHRLGRMAPAPAYAIECLRASIATLPPDMNQRASMHFGILPSFPSPLSTPSPAFFPSMRVSGGGCGGGGGGGGSGSVSSASAPPSCAPGSTRTGYESGATSVTVESKGSVDASGPSGPAVQTGPISEPSTSATTLHGPSEGIPAASLGARPMCTTPSTPEAAPMQPPTFGSAPMMYQPMYPGMGMGMGMGMVGYNPMMAYQMRMGVPWAPQAPPPGHPGMVPFGPPGPVAVPAAFKPATPPAPGPPTAVPSPSPEHAPGPHFSGSEDAADRQHRATCHRCGNIRVRKTECISCPQVWCGRCTEKMRKEYGEDVFSRGCPKCLLLCCCGPNRRADCNRTYHCYKKCPLTKKGLSTLRNKADAEPQPPLPPPPAAAGPDTLEDLKPNLRRAKRSAAAAAEATLLPAFGIKPPEDMHMGNLNDGHRVRRRTNASESQIMSPTFGLSVPEDFDDAHRESDDYGASPPPLRTGPSLPSLPICDSSTWSGLSPLDSYESFAL